MPSASVSRSARVPVRPDSGARVDRARRAAHRHACCCAAGRTPSRAACGGVQRAELRPGDAHDVVVVAVGGGPAAAGVDGRVALPRPTSARARSCARARGRSPRGSCRGRRRDHRRAARSRPHRARTSSRPGGRAAADVEQQVLAGAGHEVRPGGGLVPQGGGLRAAGRGGDPVVRRGDAEGDRAVGLLRPEVGDRAVHGVGDLLRVTAVRGGARAGRRGRR